MGWFSLALILTAQTPTLLKIGGDLKVHVNKGLKLYALAVHCPHGIGPLLARAVRVPVCRRSGGRPATTLVATINDILLVFSFCEAQPQLNSIQLDFNFS